MIMIAVRLNFLPFFVVDSNTVGHPQLFPYRRAVVLPFDVEYDKAHCQTEELWYSLSLNIYYFFR